MSNSNLNNTVQGRLSIRDVFRSCAEWRTSRRLRRQWSKFYRNWFFGDHAAQHSEGFREIVEYLNSAHDLDEMAFRILGARYGAFPESVQDEEYYIDADNGSDTEGNGTFDAPYASLWFLPYFLPKRIDHHYRIVILSDLTEEVLYLNTEFGPFGSLAFIGRGAPIVADTRVVSLSIGHAGLHQIDTTVGGLSDEQYTSYFMRDDGAANGEAHAIFYNSAAGSFRTSAPWHGAIAGPDTISFVRPAVTLSIAGISIGCGSPKLAVEDSGSTIGARIGFFNLDLDVRNTAKEIAIDLETGTSAYASFCRIIYDDAVQIPLKIKDTELNHEAFIDEDVEDYAQSGIVNLITDPIVFKPAGLIMHNTDGFLGAHQVLHIEGNSRVNCVSHRQETLARRTVCTSIMCAFNTLWVDDAIMWAQYLGIGWLDGTRSINVESGTLRIVTLSTYTPIGVLGCGGDIIHLGGAGSLPGFARFALNTHDLANSPVGWQGYGVNVYSPSAMFFSSTPVTLTGTSGDCVWNTLGGPIPAIWPAAGAGITDAAAAPGAPQSAFASVHA